MATTTTTTTAVGPNYMSIFGAPIMTAATTTTGKSPSKAELAAEKRRLQSWARLLRSFRRHRRHHSPLYVLLSMRMDCAPAECLIDFDVVFMKCPEETTTEEPAAAVAAVAAETTKVNGKVKPRVKAEAIEVDVGYCSSVNSSTSDYKSGDEMTTEEEEEENEEKEEKKSEDENKKNKVDDAMTSYAVVQFTLGQPSSSEPSLSTSSNQVAFKAKTILDACTQMINFMAALDSLTTRYDKRKLLFLFRFTFCLPSFLPSLQWRKHSAA